MFGGNGHFQYSKGNNSKSRKTRVTVMRSACHLMVLTFVSMFMKIMSSGFKIMEQTRKLLTHKGQ